MGRAIITISESGKVNIPSGNVWMSEMELVELYHKDGFGEIVDIECKFGQGNKPGASSMY